MLPSYEHLVDVTARIRSRHIEFLASEFDPVEYLTFSSRFITSNRGLLDRVFYSALALLRRARALSKLACLASRDYSVINTCTDDCSGCGCYEPECYKKRARTKFSRCCADCYVILSDHIQNTHPSLFWPCTNIITVEKLNAIAIQLGI